MNRLHTLKLMSKLVREAYERGEISNAERDACLATLKGDLA